MTHNSILSQLGLISEQLHAVLAMWTLDAMVSFGYSNKNPAQGTTQSCDQRSYWTVPPPAVEKCHTQSASTTLKGKSRQGLGQLWKEKTRAIKYKHYNRIWRRISIMELWKFEVSQVFMKIHMNMQISELMISWPHSPYFEYDFFIENFGTNNIKIFSS